MPDLLLELFSEKNSADLLSSLRPPKPLGEGGWRGGVGGGGCLGIDSCIDHRENTRDVFTDLVIPESQNTIAIRFEVLRAQLIGLAVSMLAAIQLDHNSQLMTGEVGEVRTDRRLTPEMVLLEWRLPQMLPEFLFSFSRVAT